MVRPLPMSRLSRWLFRLSWLAAAVLIALVLLGPWLDNKMPSRLLALFARDAVVRRTAVASALGLVATACVFFRSPGAPRRLSTRRRRLPPPPDLAGA